MRIDLDSDIPAYRQIVNTIRILLVTGNLIAGRGTAVGTPHGYVIWVCTSTRWLNLTASWRMRAGWTSSRRGATVIERDVPQPSPEAWRNSDSACRSLAAEYVRRRGRSEKIVAAELWRALE